MNKKAEEQPFNSTLVRLYPPGMISLLTFLTAFPAGYILMIINWRRLGKRDKEQSYIFGLAFSSLFMFLLLPFYMQTGFGAFIINIAFGIYFYNDMASAMNDYEQIGHSYTKENLFTGCLIGILAVIAWIIIAAMLAAAINFLVGLFLFNLQ
jgi:hypothetical protein